MDLGTLVANKVKEDDRDSLRAELTAVIKQRNELLHVERNLSDAYIRLRAKLNAFDTPWAPTPEQVYSHTEAKLDELIKQRDELMSKVAAWEQKAANWMASPEAAQRLDGYRDIANRLNLAEMQRDELLAAICKYLPESDHYSEDGVKYYSELLEAIASVKEK